MKLGQTGSSAETDVDELEEDECQETEDLRSGINMNMVRMENKPQVTSGAIRLQMQLM